MTWWSMLHQWSIRHAVDLINSGCKILILIQSNTKMTEKHRQWMLLLYMYCVCFSLSTFPCYTYNAPKSQWNHGFQRKMRLRLTLTLSEKIISSQGGKKALFIYCLRKGNNSISRQKNQKSLVIRSRVRRGPTRLDCRHFALGFSEELLYSCIEFLYSILLHQQSFPCMFARCLRQTSSQKEQQEIDKARCQETHGRGSKKGFDWWCSIRFVVSEAGETSKTYFCFAELKSTMTARGCEHWLMITPNLSLCTFEYFQGLLEYCSNIMTKLSSISCQNAPAQACPYKFP